MDIETESYKPTFLGEEPSWSKWRAFAGTQADSRLRYIVNDIKNNESNKSQEYNKGIIDNGIYQFPIMNYKTPIEFTD